MAAAMASKEMAPANPPLPWPRYLPFQPLSGNQTSILMSESADGVRAAETRQKAGRFLMTVGLPGRVNAPVVTDCAAVIFVFGSESWARLSQVFGVANAASDADIKADRAIRIVKISLVARCILVSWIVRDVDLIPKAAAFFHHHRLKSTSALSEWRLSLECADLSALYHEPKR